mmetsp:Transcript_1443/g.2640  ORF Transcript_1443/g.2640 Transcript_1443/m.2640 type:complete len:625 (+) Transcript_1443:121-1995(+)
MTKITRQQLKQSPVAVKVKEEEGPQTRRTRSRDIIITPDLIRTKDDEEKVQQEDELLPSSPQFIFQNVTYNTYQEMVQAKRAYNQQVLEKSGLLEASANLRDTTSRTPKAQLQRGLSSKRKLDRSHHDASSGLHPFTMIRRKSSRIAGMEADGMFIEEERVGGKVVIGGVTKQEGEGVHYANIVLAEKESPLFYSNRVNDGSDLILKDAVELTGYKWIKDSSVARAEAFVSTCSDLHSTTSSPPPSSFDSFDSTTCTSLSSQVEYLSVNQQECVAKVVPDRIYSVAFHPCSHKLIATTGDKNGYLGLWDIDATCTESGSGSGGSNDDMDGVYLFKPHSGAVNNLEWNMSGSQLLSQSYDGTIRIMDVQKQVFVNAFAAYDDSEEYKGMVGYGMDEGSKYYTQYACYDLRNEDGIFLSTSLGGVVHLDLRSKAKVTFNLALSEKKINSLSLHANGYTLATAGLDCTVNLWDIRNFTGLKSRSKPKPYANLKSAKSINSAFFSPSGKSLLTTTMANTLDLIHDAHLQNGLITSPTHRIRHDNNTGRWLSTFMARWHPTYTNEELFIVGSMAKPRRMEFFNGDDGNLIRAVDGEALTAVVSRCCFHPSTDRLIALGGNSSGRLTVAR